MREIELKNLRKNPTTFWNHTESLFDYIEKDLQANFSVRQRVGLSLLEVFIRSPNRLKAFMKTHSASSKIDSVLDLIEEMLSNKFLHLFIEIDILNVLEAFAETNIALVKTEKILKCIGKSLDNGSFAAHHNRQKVLTTLRKTCNTSCHPNKKKEVFNFVQESISQKKNWINIYLLENLDTLIKNSKVSDTTDEMFDLINECLNKSQEKAFSAFIDIQAASGSDKINKIFNFIKEFLDRGLDGEKEAGLKALIDFIKNDISYSKTKEILNFIKNSLSNNFLNLQAKKLETLETFIKTPNVLKVFMKTSDASNEIDSVLEQVKVILSDQRFSIYTRGYALNILEAFIETNIAPDKNEKISKCIKNLENNGSLANLFRLKIPPINKSIRSLPTFKIFGNPPEDSNKTEKKSNPIKKLVI